MSPMKKVPLRKCIGCQEQKSKKELLRILRTDDGRVIFDRSGRMNGRGAYICDSSECLEKAFRSRALERSLKTSVSQETKESLKKEIDEYHAE